MTNPTPRPLEARPIGEPLRESWHAVLVGSRAMEKRLIEGAFCTVCRNVSFHDEDCILHKAREARVEHRRLLSKAIGGCSYD